MPASLGSFRRALAAPAPGSAIPPTATCVTTCSCPAPFLPGWRLAGVCARGPPEQRARQHRAGHPLWGEGHGPRPAAAPPPVQREGGVPSSLLLGARAPSPLAQRRTRHPTDPRRQLARLQEGRPPVAARYQGQLPAAPPRGGATTALAPRTRNPHPAAGAASCVFPGTPARSPELLSPLGSPPYSGFWGLARHPVRAQLGAALSPAPRLSVRETRAEPGLPGKQDPGSRGASKQRPRRSDRRGCWGPRRGKGCWGPLRSNAPGT